MLGSTVAATDAAAVFAVLRGSTLRRKIARTLEGESGVNDPVAVLLVIGCIEAIHAHGTYTGWDVLWLAVRELVEGAAIGLAVGYLGTVVLHAGDAAERRPVSGRVDRAGRAGLRRRGRRARLRLPRRVPRRAGDRLELIARPAHDHHVPRGARVGRAARPVPVARAAGEPARADRLHPARRGDRDRHRGDRPAAGRGARGLGLLAAGAADPRLGGPARRDPDRVRHLRRHRGDRARPRDLPGRVLRRAVLDRAAGADDRAGRALARRDLRRGRDPGAAGRARAAEPPRAPRRSSSPCARATRSSITRCARSGSRARRC